MKNFREIFIVAAIAGFMLNGCTAANHVGDAEHGMDGHTHVTEQHSHEASVDVSDAMAMPSVNVEIVPDPLSGWNVHVMTENFSFTPENSGKEHVPGEGHAHLYVDGEKVARLYGAWYHLTGLLPGTHEITVSLNANDHREYSASGKPISVTTSLTVE